MDDGIQSQHEANESNIVSAKPTAKTSCSNVVEGLRTAESAEMVNVEIRSDAEVPSPSTSKSTANSETLVTEVLDDDICFGQGIKTKNR